MSLTTFSKFYYGQIINTDNYSLDFSEGGPELEASVSIGDYTLSTLPVAVKTQLDALGSQEYDVSVDRDTRRITISSVADFELLVFSGPRSGVSVFSLLGFTGADRTGSNSYTGDSPSGFEYSPQFILQDHVPTANYKNFIDPSVNVSSNGEVEVVKFGVQRFLQANIKYATNEQHPAVGPIENNPTGVDDLISFMDYCIEKNKIEYMANRNDAGTYEIVLLEDSGSNGKEGTGYKLKELYTESLPFHFETGVLKFRKAD